MTWSSTATRGRTGPRRPLGEPGGFGSLAFSIPLGFRTGRPFSPLSRAISSRWAATVCSRAATLPSNSMTRAFSSVGESASRSPGGAILPGNQRSTGQESEKRAATSFAAGTVFQANRLRGLGVFDGLGLAAGSGRRNLDAARLERFRHFPLQVDRQQAVVEVRARHLDVIGEIEALLESAGRDAAMQVLRAVLRTFLLARHEQGVRL